VSCGVGLAVLHALRSENLVERVRVRGAALLEQLRAELEAVPIVREIRGRGFLLGVSFADPRDGESFLPPELGVAGRVDRAAFERQLITLSTMPTRDGFAGDQTLFAPPFTTTDDELAEMVSRFVAAVRQVDDEVSSELGAASHPTPTATRTATRTGGTR
jgi:adenosylmethionine-8-amino-7-oxononanoate aminotransferase